MAYTTPVMETVKPNADEQARLNTVQQTAIETHASYGSQLIAKHYEHMQAVQ